MRFLDRSRIEADWECPRLRYLNYEYRGRGVAPAKAALDLELGTIVHDGIEQSINAAEKGLNRIWPSEIDSPFNRAKVLVASLSGEEQDQKQYAALAQGLVDGFMRVVWPKIAEDYELVAIEREVSLQLTPELLFQARPDILARNRATGQLWYFELKTTGSVDAQWLQSWQKAPQLQLGALAAEAELGEPLAGCYVIGLYKGRKYYGRLSSPFAWGWRSEEIPGVLPSQYSYSEQRRKGWERFLVADHPAGVSSWIASMPEEIISQQFVQTDPIFLRRDVTDALLRQVIAREREIAEALKDGTPSQDVLDRVFRQHFFNCTPAWGHDCAFKDACWIPWMAKDPMKSGLFGWREPHHEAERKFWELKEVA